MIEVCTKSVKVVSINMSLQEARNIVKDLTYFRSSDFKPMICFCPEIKELQREMKNIVDKEDGVK